MGRYERAREAASAASKEAVGGTRSFHHGTPRYNQRSELGSQGRLVRRRRRSQSRESSRRSPSREPSTDGRPSASAKPDGNMGGEYACVWGTNVNIPDVLRAIRRFLNNYRSSAEDLDSKYIQLIQETVERDEDTEHRHVQHFRP